LSGITCIRFQEGCNFCKCTAKLIEHHLIGRLLAFSYILDEEVGGCRQFLITSSSVILQAISEVELDIIIHQLGDFTLINTHKNITALTNIGGSSCHFLKLKLHFLNIFFINLHVLVHLLSLLHLDLFHFLHCQEAFFHQLAEGLEFVCRCKECLIGLVTILYCANAEE